MNLHDKILQLLSIGFDVKFEQFILGVCHLTNNTYISLRYNGNQGVKVENRKMFTPEQIKNESFIVSEIEILYQEMKGHAYGDKQYYLNQND